MVVPDPGDDCSECGEALPGESSLIQSDGQNGVALILHDLNGEANARLIAEAPAMLEALKLRERHGHNDTCQHMLDSVYKCNCGYGEAVSVIAKATGN